MGNGMVQVRGALLAEMSQLRPASEDAIVSAREVKRRMSTKPIDESPLGHLSVIKSFREALHQATARGIEQLGGINPLASVSPAASSRHKQQHWPNFFPSKTRVFPKSSTGPPSPLLTVSKEVPRDQKLSFTEQIAISNNPPPSPSLPAASGDIFWGSDASIKSGESEMPLLSGVKGGDKLADIALLKTLPVIGSHRRTHSTPHATTSSSLSSAANSGMPRVAYQRISLLVPDENNLGNKIDRPERATGSSPSSMEDPVNIVPPIPIVVRSASWKTHLRTSSSRETEGRTHQLDSPRSEQSGEGNASSSQGLLLKQLGRS